MTERAIRRPWTDELEAELIAACANEESVPSIAARMGRQLNALEQKISQLRRLGRMKAADAKRQIRRRQNQDGLHVIACLAQGGFPAFSEKQDPGSVYARRCLNEGGFAAFNEMRLSHADLPPANRMTTSRVTRAVCLPLIWPTRL